MIVPILQEKSDLICLQEYWFEQRYRNVFEDALSDEYSFHSLKRPGGKEDGLAIFTKKNRFRIHKVTNLSFTHSGERVAILMHLSIGSVRFVFNRFRPFLMF